MLLTSSLYSRLLQAARGRHAKSVLALVAFIESSIFPIPPDVVLGPMVLSEPHKASHYALWTTLWSVIGGCFGYAIGYYVFDSWGVAIISSFEIEHHYARLVEWFNHYGVWMVVLAGFTPIPYKLFTIGAGAMVMPLGPFLLASVIGRGLRFTIVAALLKVMQAPMERMVRHPSFIRWLGVMMLLIVSFGMIVVYR